MMKAMINQAMVTPIGLQLVMSLATHACTPEDNHG